MTSNRIPKAPFYRSGDSAEELRNDYLSDTGASTNVDDSQVGSILDIHLRQSHVSALTRGKSKSLNTSHGHERRLLAQHVESAKSGFSWENPRPLDALLDTQIEFPVEACGKFLSPVVAEIAEICQAPVGLAANAVLSASAFAVQRLYNCGQMGPLPPEPCSLFVLSIAESGDRKSAVDGMACRAIRRWEENCVRSGGYPFVRPADDKLQEAQSGNWPSSSIVLFTDVTYADFSSRLIKGNYPSIGIFSDEAGTFFGNYSMTAATRQSAVSGYVTLWNSGEVSRYRLTDEKGSGKVFNRRLTINLMAQPVSMKDTLADPYLRAQGFLPRFLITKPSSRAGSRFLQYEQFCGQRKLSQSLQGYESRIQALLEIPVSINGGAGLITKNVDVSDAAQYQFVNLYNQFEKELRADDLAFPAQLRPFQARVAQHARRLATVLAVMNGEQTVSETTMVSAFKIAEHSLDTWRNLIGCNDAERIYSEAQQLLTWMAQKPKYRTIRDLQRYGPRFVRECSSRLRSLVELLEEYYWLRYDINSKSLEINLIGLNK